MAQSNLRRSLVGQIVAGEKRALIFSSLCAAFVCAISLAPFVLHSLNFFPGIESELNTTKNATAHCENHILSTSVCKRTPRRFQFRRFHSNSCTKTSVTNCDYAHAELELHTLHSLIEKYKDTFTNEERNCSYAMWNVLCLSTYRECSEDPKTSLVRNEEEFKLCQATKDECLVFWKEAEKLQKKHGFCLRMPQCSSFRDGVAASTDVKPNCSAVPPPRCNNSAYENASEKTMRNVLLWFFTVLGYFLILAIILTWIGQKQRCPPSGIQMMALSYFLIVIAGSFPIIVGRVEMFCKHENIYDNIMDPPVLCKIQGAAVNFGILNFSLWWLISLANVLATISSFSTPNVMSRNPKRTFGVQLALVLLSSSATIVALFALDPLHRGYTSTSLSVAACAPSTAKAAFYALVLLPAVTVPVGMIIAIVIIQKLRKNPIIRQYLTTKEDRTGTLAEAFDVITRRFIFQLLIYPLILSAILIAFVIYIEFSSHDLIKAHEKCSQSKEVDSIPLCRFLRTFFYLSELDVMLFMVIGCMLFFNIVCSGRGSEFWSEFFRRFRRRNKRRATKKARKRSYLETTTDESNSELGLLTDE